VAQALQKEGCEIIWFGHKYSMRGVTNLSLEWQEVTRGGIRFVNLKAGKIHQGGINEWFRLIDGFFQALWLLIKIRPRLIVSFGGYLAVPTVLAGYLLRIPSVTHEQTIVAGKANRLLRHFVKIVFLTWPESQIFFPADKTVLVGLPLREEIIHPSQKSFFPPHKKMILITGGKQGSHVINQTIAAILPELLSRFNVLQQTGETSTTDDYQKLCQARDKLPANLKKSYQVVKYLSPVDMGAALKQATCVVSRSGAHTVYELLLLVKPAVLIPLPFSFANEQQRHALKLAQMGLGKIITQSSLSPQRLFKAIDQQANLSLKDLKSIQSQAKQMVILDAKTRMVNYLKRLLS